MPRTDKATREKHARLRAAAELEHFRQAAHDLALENIDLKRKLAAPALPVPMILTCPMCGTRHIDEGEFATKPHHTHACQKCGMCWRPAVVATVGVWFLSGFKNEEKTP